jgi:multisubunit Na+/H+ antiporter MnhF subunit
VNAFAWAGFGLLVGYVPLLAIVLRRRPLDGLLALEMGGILLVLELLCLAEAFHRSFEYAVAIVAAMTTWIGGLVFVRFFGRWV